LLFLELIGFYAKLLNSFRSLLMFWRFNFQYLFFVFAIFCCLIWIKFNRVGDLFEIFIKSETYLRVSYKVEEQFSGLL
jgi:hypothetical protein